MSTLPMRDVVDVIINLSPRATIRKNFNLALLPGTSDVIPVEKRVVEFSGMEDIKEYGFTAEMPEYKAASIFFMSSERPRRLLIGRIGADEEVLDAIEACRTANREWYSLMSHTQVEADVLTMAAFTESAVPSTLFSFTTTDIELVKKLKGLNYRRTLATVSQNELLHIGVMAWAMGAQTGLRDSAYTLFAKKIVGIPTDDWEVDDIKGFQQSNANYYINRGDIYDMFEQGVMVDGTWFDEMINLDKLANDMQLSLMDVITTVRKVAQTEGGVEVLRATIVDPLEEAKKIGFIAPGTWKGESFMELLRGDMLPLGYLIQNDALEQQSPSDRDNRFAPPIYVAVKLAGAFHYIIIQVNVNR